MKKKSLLAAPLSLLGLSAVAQTAQPNILFISADDLGYDFLNCSGNTTPDLSPNIDHLASESMRFMKSFVTAAISQPSRSVWITGCYPHRNGAIGFNPITQPRAMLGEQLRKAGYYTSLLGKGPHYAPDGPEHWDMFVGHLAGAGRDSEVFAAELREAIVKASEAGKPFFIHANCADPHRPFSKSPVDYKDMKDPSRLYSPDEVYVPDYICNTPEARQEIAWYCNSVRRLDDIVGTMLKLLDKMKLSDDTIVIFASDNGAPLPFCKGNCYLQSNRTPLMIRMKGLKPGADYEHWINGIDMMPTILDMASAPQPEYMDGKSFYPLLQGGTIPVCDHVHVVFHRDQFLHFEQRAIHNEHYGYIYNEWRAWEQKRDVNFVADNNPSIFGSCDDPAVAARYAFYLKRAPEELYDYTKDPYALNNVVDDPAYVEVLEEMRGHLHQWMIETYDYAEQGYMMYLQPKTKKRK